ncbi:MAG: ATP-binding protein, partial [Pseudomonadota bacterium]
NHTDLLDIPSNGFSANLLELVDERLRSSVALVLRRSETEDKAEKSGARLVRGETVETINITCRKISWEAHALAYAVTFHRRIEPSTLASESPTAAEAPNMPTQAYIQHLESEVQSLQDMLSATAEDLGASNEELQTTNEELIASNEELQANNEETQSINEELHTLNAENAEKIAELEAATGDINNLLATADLGVLVLDDELCIRQFSDGVYKYVNLEHGDIGRPLSNFAVMFDADSLTRLMDDIRLSRDYGEENTRELQTRRGGFAFCRVRPYRNVHGDLRGVVITLQDITDLKLLEEEVRQQRDRLEALLESEAAGYWDWDIPEGTLFMSSRYKSMFGYDDDEIENSPKGRDALIYPEDRHIAREAFDRHVSSGGKIPYDVEKRFVHKDGSLIWVWSRGRVLEWTEDQQPKRMMGVHIEITEQKDRELEVQHRADEVRRFAFIAAHDLVQPMNTIANCLSAMEEDLPRDLDGDMGQMMTFLNASVLRMKERINGILDFARLLDEEIQLDAVDMNAVLKDCLDDLGTQIAEAKAEITVAELPSMHGAHSMVLRVVQNVLSNALKYRHKDRPCQIRVVPAPAPEGMAAISIIDNGIGIPEKYRTRIFELFSRLHTEDEYSGSGLGLALSERIVKQLHGKISVNDGDDGGAAFVITLKAG